MRRINLAVLSFLLSTVLAFAAEPRRSEGISIHMLPKRVAQMSGRAWGLSVDYSPKLKAETAQPVLQSPQELLSYVRKQEEAVQQNGVWIVITNPGAYSTEETKLLDEIKSVCRSEKIPLFVSRASELPNGWKRYDQ